MNRILPFVFILVAIGVFFGYVRTTWQGSVASSKAEIESYDRALSAAAEFRAKEAALETERAQLPPAALERLNTFLPDSVDNVQLILDLNALATRSGISLSDFTMNDGSKKGDANSGGQGASSLGANQSFAAASPFDSLTMTVRAVGTYNAFRSFLAGVEQSLRPLDVTEITVQDSDTGVYTYEVTLAFYWLH